MSSICQSETQCLKKNETLVSICGKTTDMSDPLSETLCLNSA